MAPAALLLLVSGPAWGLGFTLEEVEETWTHPKGTELTFLQFDPTAVIGNPSLVTLDPPFDPSSQDFFVFQVRVDGPDPIGNLTLESIAPFVFPASGPQETALGMGYLDIDVGEDPTGGSVQLFGFNPQFDYTGAELGLGEVSEPLIVTYALDTLDVDGTVEFMVQVDGQGNLSPEFPIIPEPQTAMLLGTGLLGLLTVARRSKATRPR